MWDIAPLQDGVSPSSSRPMASAYYRGYPAKPQQPGGYPAKPQQPGGYPAKPQQPGGYPAKPQQPGGYPAKPQQPGGYPAKPGGFPAKPQQPGNYPAKPQAGILQSKAGMWDIAFSQEGVAPRSFRPIQMASLQHPRWQRPLVPAYNRLRQP
ncbi:protein lifeguard 1-like [Sparus aurata]|uniref:protein lifeguard 1-like n=1 Tax=Sparus aurata TaxID=8175 RepID=UPI0011C1091B|nr:protein lifeguard 1-like [Sparus aurata]